MVPYFEDTEERVKMQITSKITQRYLTTKRLIRDLLSNTPNCYFSAGEIRGYLFAVHWSTNTVRYLFWVLFVLYDAQLYNK